MKREYRSEGSRIRYAVQWLPFDKMDIWGRKESEYEEQGQRPTWNQFAEFLLDLIEDPTYRPFRNLQRYLTAVQGEQPIQRFVVHLEQLETEIPALSEELRHLILLCKMKPTLQQEILKIFPAPVSRDGLVAAAARIEESHRMRLSGATTPNNRYTAPRSDDHRPHPSRTDTQRDRPNFRGPGRGQDRSRGAPRSVQGRETAPQPARFTPHSDVNRIPTGDRRGGAALNPRTPLVCFKCQRPGHYASECYSKTFSTQAVQAGNRPVNPKK